jgi:hypothetical protein
VRDESALYYVASSAKEGVVVFSKRDDDDRWRFVRALPIPPGFCPYAIGANRAPYNGQIVGTFTARNSADCPETYVPAETWQFSVPTQGKSGSAGIR